MKRKLSLGMAIVTKPKLIILDEPTSGLDVESRRQIWDLIKKIKENRSIIMSSQHLEEADELADRIMIMTKGEILTVNTAAEIKKEFGVGYKLLVEAKPSSNVQLVDLKEEIEQIVISEDNKRLGIIENMDSTERRLIF